MSTALEKRIRAWSKEALDAAERAEAYRDADRWVESGTVARLALGSAADDMERIADELDRLFSDPDELRRLADLAEERLEAEEEARAAALEAEALAEEAEAS